MIKLSENIPYAHTSICLNDKFEVFYSFGRKSKYNFLKCGFVIENVTERYLKWYPNSRIRILEIPVTTKQYETIEQKIQYFVEHIETFRYNLRGILLIKTSKRKTNPYHLFCSQFVNYILKESGIHLIETAPEYTTPKMFYQLDYPIIYEGNVQKFSSAIKQVKRVNFCYE